MPAGPIGSTWASGSWSNTAWEANTWANASAHVIPSVLEDLTTLWCQQYQPALHAAHAVGLGFDDTTLIHADLVNALGYDGEQDLNTAYAKYIDTEF